MTQQEIKNFFLFYPELENLNETRKQNFVSRIEEKIDVHKNNQYSCEKLLDSFLYANISEETRNEINETGKAAYLKFRENKIKEGKIESLKDFEYLMKSHGIDYVKAYGIKNVGYDALEENFDDEIPAKYRRIAYAFVGESEFADGCFATNEEGYPLEAILVNEVGEIQIDVKEANKIINKIAAQHGVKCEIDKDGYVEIEAEKEAQKEAEKSEKSKIIGK